MVDYRKYSKANRLTGAWNKKSKIWVKWIGYKCSIDTMDKELGKLRVPSHVISRPIPRSSFWGKKDACKRRR